MKKHYLIRLVMLSICLIYQQAFSQFQLEIAFPNLSFSSPVDFQNAGDGSDRIFVVEQRGVIRVFGNHQEAGGTLDFLDIQARVDDTDGEQGLLGLAFHPDYENNGYFYVNYIFDPGPGNDRTRISRFKVSDTNPNAAEPDSELICLNLCRILEIIMAVPLLLARMMDFYILPWETAALAVIPIIGHKPAAAFWDRFCELMLITTAPTAIMRSRKTILTPEIVKDSGKKFLPTACEIPGA